MEPEQKLFLAIVAQAFLDATANPPSKPVYAEWVKKRRKREAKRGIEESDIALAAGWQRAMRQYNVAFVAHLQDRNAARIWLTRIEPEMALICSLAGYTPEYIRSNAIKLGERGWKTDATIKRYTVAIAA